MQAASSAAGSPIRVTASIPRSAKTATARGLNSSATSTFGIHRPRPRQRRRETTSKKFTRAIGAFDDEVIFTALSAPSSPLYWIVHYAALGALGAPDPPPTGPG